jgi:hypothetical protein
MGDVNNSGSSRNSNTLNLPLLPQPIKHIAYINEREEASNVQASEVLAVQIPKHIPYNVRYPIRAPSNGAVVENVLIKQQGGYHPGAMYMRKVTAKEMPYTVHEQRLKHTIDKITLEQQKSSVDTSQEINNNNAKDIQESSVLLFKPIKKSIHDEERVERGEYLDSFLAPSTTTGKETNTMNVDDNHDIANAGDAHYKKAMHSKLKAKETRLQLLSGALQQLVFASQALSFILGNGNSKQHSENNSKNSQKQGRRQQPLLLKLYNTPKRSLINEKYASTNLANAIVNKQAQLKKMTNLFQEKACSIRQNLDTSKSYHKKIAILAEKWTLKCKKRMEFTPLSSTDELFIDCSNKIFGSLFRCETENTNELLDAATLAGFKVNKFVDNGGIHHVESRIAIQVPKSCAFFSIQIYVQGDKKNEYTLPISSTTMPYINSKACCTLNAIRHSIFCEELFKTIHKEALHIITSSKRGNSDIIETFQILDLDDDIIKIKLNRFGTIAIALVRANTYIGTGGSNANNTNPHFIISKGIGSALEGNMHGIWSRNSRNENGIGVTSSLLTTSTILLNVITLLKHYIIRESIKTFLNNYMDMQWSKSYNDVIEYGNYYLENGVHDSVLYLSNTKFIYKDIICSILVRNANNIQATFVQQNKTFLMEKMQSVKGFKLLFCNVFQCGA